MFHDDEPLTDMEQETESMITMMQEIKNIPAIPSHISLESANGATFTKQIMCSFLNMEEFVKKFSILDKKTYKVTLDSEIAW